MKMGRHPHNASTVAKVRTVKEPGMYADGQGLYLRVDPSGARRWVQRIVVQGKRRNLGLGGWPAVSLAEAREQAIVNLQLIRAGDDPLAVKRREAMPTVAEAAVKVIALNRPTWTNSKHTYQWVVVQFESPRSETISSAVHTRSVRPAAIAGVVG